MKLFIYFDDLEKIIYYFVDNRIKTIELDIASDDTRRLRDFIIRIKEITNTDINFIFAEDELHDDKFVPPDLTILKNIIKNISFFRFWYWYNEYL